MQKRNLVSFLIAALLFSQSVGYVGLSWVSQSVPSRGFIDYDQNNQVKVYDFRRCSRLAPWWRVRLSEEAKMKFSPQGLNLSDGWGVLYLHETAGNMSALLELTSESAAFGVGFIGVDGKSWRVQWHDGKLWFYHASDRYDNCQSEHLMSEVGTIAGLGIEFLDSLTIGFCAKSLNGSFVEMRFSTPLEISRPKYVQLLFSAGTAYLTRLSVAPTLDQILESNNAKNTEYNLWYPRLNLTIPQDLRYFGVVAQMLGREGNVPFRSQGIDQQLAFLREHEFGVIKLMLDWQVLMPSIGVFNESAFLWVSNFSRWMNSEGFHVLLTMQSYDLSYISRCNETYEANDEWLNSLISNDSLRMAFVQTWVRIAQCVRYLDVSYELLNEPDSAESSGITGFTKLVKFEEEIGNAIRNQDSEHTIYINIYQWQDKHRLWAAQDVHFNFTNYGFSLHVYPTDKVWSLPSLGYDATMIQWLKSNRFPILVSEVPMTALDPWISESVLNDPSTWSQAWVHTFSFVLGFDKLAGVVFLRYMVTAHDSYSNLGVCEHVFKVFSDQVLNGSLVD